MVFIVRTEFDLVLVALYAAAKLQRLRRNSEFRQQIAAMEERRDTRKDKRSQFLIRSRKETLPVAAMRVRNPDRSHVRIHG